jgi:hypothetical protein
MRWAVHAARMGEMKNAHKIPDRNHERMRLFRIWEDNIKTVKFSLSLL